MEVILRYLPTQLSDEQLRQRLEEIIARVQASGLKDLGKVMQEAKSLSDVADGRRISTMAKSLLQ